MRVLVDTPSEIQHNCAGGLDSTGNRPLLKTSGDSDFRKLCEALIVHLHSYCIRYEGMQAGLTARRIKNFLSYSRRFVCIFYVKGYEKQGCVHYSSEKELFLLFFFRYRACWVSFPIDYVGITQEYLVILERWNPNLRCFTRLANKLIMRWETWCVPMQESKHLV